ncbi:MAG: EscJ/YscJ/HrcJ family type III secretion inner membrane ring protein [Chlamydiae bacterium CG10_big_fil_rev_8_21_14_0_10_35_9]|nr:MAG: EscJ/YscJ/HrcJ family type III secretion inner membrane ring protein [Chlamydiae bacterium CG10_big_fil_rev_8_21_14_0_10_35_9]
MRYLKSLCLVVALLFLSGCETNLPIVNNVDEREANEIIVYLANNGISAQKISASAGEIAGAGGGGGNMWNIAVEQDNMVRAMGLLNEVGLPRRQGTNLLELFAKTGLMSSDRESTIRYHAGLAEELKNTIRKMDGVLDADVQISFPLEEPGLGEAPPKLTAAVFVKHMGVLDDPNNHLDSKIKRLVAGSIPKMTYDSVSVISDRSRFMTAIQDSRSQTISTAPDQDYVKLWSIVMSKSSVGKFRFLFFLMIILVLGFGSLAIWLLIKFYPQVLQNVLQVKKILPSRKKPKS